MIAECRHGAPYEQEEGYRITDADKFAKDLTSHLLYEGVSEAWAANPDFAIVSRTRQIVASGIEAGMKFVEAEFQPAVTPQSALVSEQFQGVA